MRHESKSVNITPKTDLLPGHLLAQRIKCGRPNCRCARGHLHGPYYYRCWTDNGQRRKVYVRKRDVSAVRAACDAYRSERKLLRLERQVVTQQIRRLLGPIGQHEGLVKAILKGMEL